MNTAASHHKHPHIAEAVERNIHTLLEIRRQMELRKTPQERIADGIRVFSGSTMFVYFNAVWFLVWIAINLGWTPLKVFDPFPFGFLTMLVSLEAIFLSTFVLISQNRMSSISDQRSDLDLQINLLAEYEITKVLRIVDAIADHLQLEIGADKELEELEIGVSPRTMLREMEKQAHRLHHDKVIHQESTVGEL
ncbi:MAG: DUF1003 domain-containing protein [Candidatus Peribacteraceae bacterium]|nr:DUF1003 domain-containing protein [Candidatus Peribacteraceae bacterium]